MKKRLCSLILCGLLLTASAAGSLSCGETAGNSPVTDDIQTDAPDTAVTETAKPEIELPKKDFGGETFRIAGFSVWGDHYLYADELNGEVLNDAIYERNSRVAEDYNVKFEYTVYDQTPNKVLDLVKQSVTAGDGAVDMALTICSNAANLMSGGYLSELTEVPSIDLTHPWWDSGSVRDLSLDNHNYFAMNSLCVLADNMTAAVFFNKDMLNDYKLENPYTLVSNGTWTWDKLYSMSKAVSKDIDGDGQMTDKDVYGVLASYNILMDGMMNGGEPMIVKDSDDLPILAMSSQRAASVCEKLLTIFADAKNVLLVDKYSGQYGDAWLDLMYPAFKTGKALFIARAYIQYVYYFRDSDVDYGILPRPKFDAEQAEYYSDVNYAWATTCMIPRDVGNPEMVGLITEALASESLKLVTPANYDVSIVKKQLRDTDSEKMLDIIYASRHYDMGQFADLCDMKAKLTAMLKANNFTFSSDYASEKESSEAKIAKYIDTFRRSNS